MKNQLLFILDLTQKHKQHIVCSNNDVNVLNSYKYLGLVLTDSLNFEMAVRSVAQSANRALGLLICKVKTNGGVPYECFVKLFDSLVWPILSYGASIWGTRRFPDIEAVFNGACRFYLGPGQQAPIVAVRGDMGMVPPLARQYREEPMQYKPLKLLPQ